MRNEAQAVVIGGGVGGASIAYHLARLGWKDVVLVEQYDLTSGSTWHSAGLVGQLRSSVSLTRMMMYSVGLYADLRRETGKDPGWHEVGGLRLASSPDRMDELRRQEGWAETFGLPLELITASDARERFPLMSLEGVLGAAWLPQDGYLDPSQLTFALADGARRYGAEIVTRTRVTGITLQRRSRARGRDRQGDDPDRRGRERRRHGRSRRRAARRRDRPDHPDGPPVPRHRAVLARARAASHAARPRQPRVLPDRGRRPRDGRVRARSRAVRTRRDTRGLRGAAADRGLGPLRGADGRARVRRVPSIEHAEVKRFFNGPEAFTPDGEFILGESEVPGFWVAAGFCAHGLAGAGGIGKVMAEWIVDGEPEYDLWHMDIRRFGRHYRSQRYALARTTEVYSQYYDIHFPGQEREAGRPLRVSAAYPRLRELGAAFGEKSGWERANWFEPNAARGDESLRPRGWAGRNWSPAIGAECLATRDAAALFDESSFAKIDVHGSGALAFLDGLCANLIDRPIGSVVYTQLLNRRGGIECDLTVTRLADDRFQLVTGTAFGAHDLGWLRRHLPGGRDRVRRRRHGVACVLRPVGAALARDPAVADEDRPRTRGVPLPARPRGLRRRRAVPRAARDLRRRARVRAVLPDRVRPRAVGLADRGG